MVKQNTTGNVVTTLDAGTDPHDLVQLTTEGKLPAVDGSQLLNIGVEALLALGETETTAYRGDRGKTAYDHSQSSHDYAASDHNHTETYQAINVDLTAITNISATSGYLRKTAESTWELTSSTSGITKSDVELVLTGAITSHTHDYAASGHTHSGLYLESISKALVEGVLTGEISSHSHANSGGTASGITTVATGFSGNLSSADDTVQKALDTLDNITIAASTHATQHVTGGSDVIANVVAAGASGLMSGSDKTKLNGIASGAEVNVQADWDQTDAGADDFIKHKPSIPSAYTLPTASAGTLGGVKIGSGITITNGVISATTGSSTFLALTDTPSSFSGVSGGNYYVRVNTAGNALEFATTSFDPALPAYNKVSENYSLPTSPDEGLVVDVVGVGTNWVITATSPHKIRLGNTVSVAGGTLSGGSGYACVSLIYIGNNEWLIKNYTGTMTLDEGL